MITLESIQNILKILTNQTLIAKFFLIILSFLFTIIAVVIARQIYILNNIVNQVNFSQLFEFLGFALIGLSIILLFFVIIAV